MKPRIEILNEKKLVGQHLQMSIADNKTPKLWQGFMPRRNEIKNNLQSGYFSIQVYDEAFTFKDFTPYTLFTKWAAVEVSDFEEIPSEMDAFILEGGLYAVFIHKGLASDFPKTFQFIFQTWLPNSDYLVDTRPHFELLHERYRPDDPDASEEVWIPIRPKL